MGWFPNPDLENETAFQTCHCEVVTTVGRIDLRFARKDGILNRDLDHTYSLTKTGDPNKLVLGS
jgi:hypothetical protein